MKIVVFGPFKRTGALHGESVVDLSRAYAKYLQERTVEPDPLEMADVVVPSDLVRLIERGSRALEAAQQALDYLFWRGPEQPRARRGLFTAQPTYAYTLRGRTTLASHAPAETSLTMLRPWR
jgi:hypothetical protein